MRPLAPAVAVMAKTPGAGAVKSRLHAALTPERATELYRCFLLDRLDAVAGLRDVSPIVAFTPAESEPVMKELVPSGFDLVPQRGADLGERLAALLAGLLERGHAGAIAIDSDSPTLPMTYVAEAARLLADDRPDVVLGPCEDGGYYLIGLRAPQPALFEGIPWSTSAVFALTLGKARARAVRARAPALVRRGHGERSAAAPRRDHEQPRRSGAHRRVRPAAAVTGVGMRVRRAR